MLLQVLEGRLEYNAQVKVGHLTPDSLLSNRLIDGLVKRRRSKSLS